jgi:hypothetical protein
MTDSVEKCNELHTQGRLVGFVIVQGNMATLLVDDVKTGLFQRSHQFSCTCSPKSSFAEVRLSVLDDGS